MPITSTATPVDGAAIAAAWSIAVGVSTIAQIGVSAGRAGRLEARRDQRATSAAEFDLRHTTAAGPAVAAAREVVGVPLGVERR